MKKKISIDPITRLEGHGNIDIFLDDNGNVENAYLQIPELRGFETFVEGRPAEDMPQITSRICGVCPGAHHMASTKTLDSLYGVTPPPTAIAIRKMYYNLHMFEDHVLHFYVLGGPDFIVGPDGDKSKRNILGVIDKVGVETGKKVIEIRKKARALINQIAGKTIHPVLGLPGGVAKQITPEIQQQLKEFGQEAVEFAQFTIKAFNDIVLSNNEYVDLIKSDIYYHETYYMGMVDENNKHEIYDGPIKVIDPTGKEVLTFKHDDYAQIIGEHVESWSYIKFPFLKKIGWKGFTDGMDSGVYRVAPLARLNVADGMSTPLAQQEYERMFDVLGGKPCHYTLASHWARLVETLNAAENIVNLAGLPDFTSPEIRNMELQIPKEGIGIVEAPRGTLIHHYKTDDRGVMTFCNLIVASLGNSAAMCMAIEKAAKKLIQNGEINDKLLNMVEMAFRSFDPCFGCATHSLPGTMPFHLMFRNNSGDQIATLTRNSDGTVIYK